MYSACGRSGSGVGCRLRFRQSGWLPASDGLRECFLAFRFKSLPAHANRASAPLPRVDRRLFQVPRQSDEAARRPLTWLAGRLNIKTRNLTMSNRQFAAMFGVTLPQAGDPPVAGNTGTIGLGGVLNP